MGIYTLSCLKPNECAPLIKETSGFWKYLTFSEKFLMGSDISKGVQKEIIKTISL